MRVFLPVDACSTCTWPLRHREAPGGQGQVGAQVAAEVGHCKQRIPRPEVGFACLRQLVCRCFQHVFAARGNTEAIMHCPTCRAFI